MTITVAAFDVDGTITIRDCVVPFMREVAGARRIGPRLVLRPSVLVPAMVRRDRDVIKALATDAAFRGVEYRRLERLGAEFAERVHSSWLRSETIDALDGHLAAGDPVVLVSASFEVYLQPLAELLGVHHVLATRVQRRDGVCTGALDGPNCRGAEKVRRLHGWLDGAGFGNRSEVRLVAYGDSAGDRELLADADEAHWVTSDGTAR